MADVRLYLVRHGEPDAGGRFYGHLDVPLTECGRGQARAAAMTLARQPIVRIAASDLQRAAWGAEQIALALATGDVQPGAHSTHVALREMHLGALEGVPHGEALQHYPEIAGRRYEDMLDVRIPRGGESVRDVAARALPELAAIVQDAARTAGAACVVVVSHNTINRVALAATTAAGVAAYGQFPQRYAAINRIDVPLEVACAAATPAELFAHARIGFADADPTAPLPA
jgi:alpha-ribazole phosphatase/probable phosphoglycerate mutase